MDGKTRCPKCKGMLSVERTSDVMRPVRMIEGGTLKFTGIYIRSNGYKCRACKVMWEAIEPDKRYEGVLVIDGLSTSPRRYEDAPTTRSVMDTI